MSFPIHLRKGENLPETGLIKATGEMRIKVMLEELMTALLSKMTVMKLIWNQNHSMDLMLWWFAQRLK